MISFPKTKTGHPHFLLVSFFMLIVCLAHAQVLRVKDGVFTDATGKLIPTITGGAIMDDALVFGNEPVSEIRVSDNGNFNFEGGFTISGELYFEEVPTFLFVMKMSTLRTDFKAGKLNSSWMSFPSEPIFTTKSTQHNYYPVGTELLNGYSDIPLKQWVKIEINYDEFLGVTTTRINDVVDRTLIRYRGKERIWNLPDQPIRFLQNATHVRVRELSFRSGPPAAIPSLNIHVNGLPFQNQVQLTFDQIDRRLPLPIAVTVSQERKGMPVDRFIMNLINLNRKDTLIPMLDGWSGDPMTVKVETAYSTQEFALTNRPASEPAPWKFPIMIYGVQLQDFRKVAGLGFNVVQNDFHLFSSGLPATNIQRSLDSASTLGMKLMVVANSGPVKLGYVDRFKSHPALYGWYIADEPKGSHMLDTVRHDNNSVKGVDENHPTLVMMNNFNRLTGLDCDIIGVDPYPVPNISMRMVADAVRAGIRASAGTKPVWAIIPHFPSKIPTKEELKSMAWLAIIAGASGIGLFEFDHRSPSTPTGYYAGAYPDYLANIGSVFREVASWDWLITATAKTYPTGNLALHACTKKANGKSFLLVANDSRREETGTVKINGNDLSLTLAPLEVRMVDLGAM